MTDPFTRPNPRPRPPGVVLPPPPDATTGRRPSAALAAVAVVGALLVGAVVVLSVLFVNRSDTAGELRSEADARASAISSARQYALDFTTYDYRTLDKDFARIEAELTGNFKKQYTATTAALKSTIVKYQGSSTSSVLAIAAQSASDYDAVVIAFVDQTIRNSASTTPQIDRNRIRMTLHRDDGRPWLITKLELP